MNKPTRPATVWLSQILLVILSIPFWLWTIGTIVVMYNDSRRIWLHAGVLYWTVPFLLLFAIPFAGLVLRKGWARVVSAIAFLTAAAIILLFVLLNLPGSMRGFALTPFLIPLMLVVIPTFLAFRLTLGKKETDFFVRSSDTYYD